MDFKELNSKSAEEILDWSSKEYPGRVALASSFGLEDMVLIDMISKLSQPIAIFTLDTGRLHEETYTLIDRARFRYKLEITTYFPDSSSVEKLLREKGFLSFRESLENRKECCKIRKVDPLNRALRELSAWVTGLRKDQNITRNDIQAVEDDKDHPPLVKINPLKDWTSEDIEAYIAKNKVPTNPLHKQNYPSIGCAPCTRSVEPGEDPRSGRWWWENPEHKECGLHQK
jgi:phosphoadenosine phosphosulfate reductase